MTPVGNVVVDAGGTIYGVTAGDAAGINNSSYPTDNGTVFSLAPGGELTTLVQFNGSNGSTPQAGLIADQAGNLYGTTSLGGAGDDGTVFKVTPGGVLTTLANFDGANGSYPEGALVSDAHGNLYGTTFFGGTTNAGTVFRISPGGVLTTIVDFDYSTGFGTGPESGLIFGPEGALYGTTAYGGADGLGTVFEVTNPSSPLAGASAVPEPAAWALIIGGAAFCGGSLRMRRRYVASAKARRIGKDEGARTAAGDRSSVDCRGMSLQR